MSPENTPIQIIPKIARWTKRGGKIKRGSSTRTEGPKRKRHYTWLLAQNAITLGWLNGHRRTRKVITHAK